MSFVRRWPVTALLAFALAAPMAMAEDNHDSAAAVPCEQRPYSILVTVNNIKDDRGVVVVELYDDVPEHFLKGVFRSDRIRVPAAKGAVTVCVPVPKAGGYAIASFHDRNDNTKFDKTWIGLPAEPYGTSNNPRFEMRAPRLDEAIFEVKGPLTPMTVTLRG